MVAVWTVREQLVSQNTTKDNETKDHVWTIVIRDTVCSSSIGRCWSSISPSSFVPALYMADFVSRRILHDPSVDVSIPFVKLPSAVEPWDSGRIKHLSSIEKCLP
jgi:hypothetical protein